MRYDAAANAGNSSTVYGAEDNLPHAPGDDEDWQESYAFVWYDSAAGVGGFQRVGQTPHLNTASAHCGLFGRDSCFRRNASWLPLRDEDRTDDLFSAGEYRLFLDDGTKLEAKDEACELSLRFEDFHPLYRYWSIAFGPDMAAGVGSDHYEAAGRVAGTVRIGGARYDVDGLAIRDHSWGARHWDAVLAHRWVAGTVGPELSFSIITMLLANGTLTRAGMAVRDGQAVRFVDTDVVLHLEPDGLTYRGGEAHGTFPDGRELRLECTVLDGIALVQRNIVSIETISTIEVDGRSGFCDLEASNNPRQGTAAPLLGLRASLSEGLTER